MASWMIRRITMRFIRARSEARNQALSEARIEARKSARHGLLGSPFDPATALARPLFPLPLLPTSSFPF
jgi:hypothetical protein